MNKYILILITFVAIFVIILSGHIISGDDKNVVDKNVVDKNVVDKNVVDKEQKLQPIVKKTLDTRQELRIYEVTINSDVCYVSEVVNQNNIVTSGGISCKFVELR